VLVIIEAELIYRPDGSFIKVPAAAYSARVRQLEAEGCDTSDAQGIADAEFLAADRLQNESPKQSPKRFDDEPTFANQLRRARELYEREGREALDNPHAMIGRQCRCGSCFCCAAAQVLSEMQDTAPAVFNPAEVQP
jgi:hypothetical protein